MSKSPIAAPPISSQGTPPTSHMVPHPQQAPPTSGESQFMQQQSQIFVFSTQMANDAAETVMAGQYKNILSFHMDQPSTKKFLQKHQMKINPFAGSPGGMPIRNVRPSLAMKNPAGMGGTFPPNSSVEQWVQQQNAQLQEQYNFPPMMNSRNGNNPGMPQWQGGMMGEVFDSNVIGMGGIPLGPHNPSLSQQKVPNENLTPEQLKKRKDALQNLQKIQEMLFPEHQQFGPGQAVAGGMMQEGMQGQMMQQNMMSPPHKRMNTQQSMPSHDMMPQQGMMGPDGMMGSPNSMMPMSQYGPGPSFMGPRGPGPQGMHNVTPAQHEWQRLQREFYIEKTHRQTMVQRMNHPNMEMSGNGPPPPSYQHSIAQKRGSVSSTSPNCNGPLGSPPMVSQGVFDSHDMFSQGPRRSSFGSLEQGPGMMNPGMTSGGHFDPMMTNMPGSGAVAPGMSGPMHGRQQKSSRRSSSSELQRVGNPEPLLPDLVPSRPSSGTSVGTSVSKPPPSYAQHAQSQKRKRSEIEEDLYKNLQPTPSPQQINYLNQFEGQELTITKQLNSAYRDPSTQESHGPGNQFGSNPVAHSPMHMNSGTNKGPMSNSSQTSSGGPLNSPGPCPMSVPGPSPHSGANMRLSHFDPPPVTNSIANTMSSTNVSSSAPLTPSNKSSLSNITSSSLADLAKGVEHLSNQMQQNMMQGGPFHSIQMQGQQATSNTNTSQSSTISSVSSTEMSSQTNTTPSVNNTFVNATMSIQQLNIQSVNAGPGGPNYPNPQMNVQQMNMEQMGGMPVSAQGPGHPNMPPASVSMSQGQAMMGNPSMSQGDINKIQQQQASVQMGNKMMMAQAQSQQSGRSASPSMHPGNTVGNASVQIQSKTPNTIQYLPAHPPANQPNAPQKPPDLNFMQRFSSPMNNFDSKVPTSKMQYFPNPQDQVMRPGRMSPFAGGPQMGGMPPQHMMQRGGSAGPEFSSIGPGGPPISGINEMMMNNMAESMGGHMGSNMGNMPQGMMPGPNEQGMMQGNMRVSPGMMAMDPMGPMSHPNSPPYDIGPEQMMGPGPAMMAGPMGSRRPTRGFPPEMMPGGRGPTSMEMMSGGSSAARLSAMSNFGPSMPPHGGQMPPHGGMRMPGGPAMAMGGPQGGNPSYSAQYQQFQQQLYSQGRPRQMSPMEGMIGGPGPGGQYMGMMPNMPGP
ncbi:B-cell CLL/lymphoma 9 protein-like isoform X2 [Ostrea edulis]|nr:B-cell CLL/lymphoma 9 protein-like isoform X2 [Ostrea edulis]